VEKLLKAFKKTDKDGKGKIGRFQLAELFQALDEFEWTPDDLNELFDAIDPKTLAL
jgi:Ca2+-binding EF-hand superfamily protein